MSYQIDTKNFKVYQLSGGIIASYPFMVSDRKYTCWFTELTVDSESVEDTVREIDFDGEFIAGENIFRVDFDYEENFITADESKLFHIPKGGYGNNFSALKDITAAISEIIDIHQRAYDCIFYFAEPATRQHDLMYQRFIVPKLTNAGYSYYVIDEDPDEGNSYIFLRVDEEA